MSLFSSIVYPQSPPFCPFTACFSPFPSRLPFCTSDSRPHVHSTLSLSFPLNHTCLMRFRFRSCATTPSNSNTVPDDGPYLDSDSKTTRVPRRTKLDNPGDDAKVFPSTIPRKPRRGRRSEAVAVEDFVRNSLESTFASIREQNPDICIEKERLLKERLDSGNISDEDDDDDDDDDETDQEAQQMVVEEDSPNWPLDADIGWGTRASEYFEKHAIKNVVGEDGTDIDWEGEIDDNWVQEINCLEWESFAFHPSPLVVLVFERYNRASDNWKVLKELENALKVYWNAKDRLPPRAVKLDINIERDLAYALKVRECPQILFLRGQRLLYRETEFRKAEDLIQMIAFFYYNAKKPSWIDEASLAV